MVVTGAAVFKRVMDAHRPPPTVTVPGQQADAPAILYFAIAEDLVPESRDLDPCPTTADCIAALVAELANGPVGDLSPVIPHDTVAEEVVITDDTATVRLSPSFAAGVPRGSRGELQAVYAIVNTICRNYPSIRQVLLRSGQDVPELGHLDLREPLTPDFTLERQSP
jgi:hypothetical protein